MRTPDRPKSGVIFRCAIYTRKSSDDGLEQEFNSLDAQREACEAYVTSQRHAGIRRRSRRRSRQSPGAVRHGAPACLAGAGLSGAVVAPPFASAHRRSPGARP
jgi:hypothetical protein